MGLKNTARIARRNCRITFQKNEAYGSLKCAELRRGKYPCNDLVGTAARMVEEAMEK